MIESTIQIKAVFDMRKVLKPAWRAWYTPNGEFCENPRKLSKLMAMGMLPGVPDLIVVSPEGKLHFLEFKSENGSLSDAQEGLSIMGDPRVTPPFRCASFRVMRVLLIASMGEELSAEELETFTSVTGRTDAPSEPVEELWIAAGRRARAWAWPLLQLISPPAATIAMFLPGERGVLPIMAGSVVQANQILNFLKGIFTGTSKFAGTVRKPPGTHASGIISDAKRGRAISVKASGLHRESGQSRQVTTISRRRPK